MKKIANYVLIHKLKVVVIVAIILLTVFFITVTVLRPGSSDFRFIGEVIYISPDGNKIIKLDVNQRKETVVLDLDQIGITADHTSEAGFGLIDKRTIFFSGFRDAASGSRESIVFVIDIKDGKIVEYFEGDGAEYIESVDSFVYFKIPYGDAAKSRLYVKPRFENANELVEKDFSRIEMRSPVHVGKEKVALFDDGLIYLINVDTRKIDTLESAEPCIPVSAGSGDNILSCRNVSGNELRRIEIGSGKIDIIEIPKPFSLIAEVPDANAWLGSYMHSRKFSVREENSLAVYREGNDEPVILKTPFVAAPDGVEYLSDPKKTEM